MKKIIFSLVMLTNCCVVSYADDVNNLTLSPSEIQKLQKYFPTDSSTQTHHIWKGEPIKIELPVDKEKRIIFPSQVSVDVKGALTTDQLRLLNNDKSIYLTALKSFPVTRIYITLQDSGKVVLVDLVVNNTATNITQQIDVPEDDVKSSTESVATATISDNSNTTENDQSPYSGSDDVSYVDLIRFAWTQTYGQDRFIKALPNYSRVPMETEKFVSDLIYGDKVIAHPESSWVINNKYVTVVSLQNKYDHVTRINIQRDLCGDWLAATLYPLSVLKAHHQREGDSTTLYLVSNKPFGEELGVCHGDA